MIPQRQQRLGNSYRSFYPEPSRPLLYDLLSDAVKQAAGLMPAACFYFRLPLLFLLILAISLNFCSFANR